MISYLSWRARDVGPIVQQLVFPARVPQNGAIRNYIVFAQRCNRVQRTIGMAEKSLQ